VICLGDLAFRFVAAWEPATTNGARQSAGGSLLNCFNQRLITSEISRFCAGLERL
jgi:hypothetical protein